MLDSQAVAKAAGAGTLASGLETSGGRIGPAVRRLTDGAVSNDAVRANEREAVRHRLLQMILRNEQLRRWRPR